MNALPQSSQVHNLVVRLLQQTSTGKVHWEQRTQDTYTVQLKSGSAAVWSRDGDGLPPYRFEVFSPDSVVVAGLDTDGPHPEPPPEWVEHVNELYRAARSSASGARQIIDGLLDELED
jgi:hypothetical protein